ncbi:hypothetical protein FOXB_15216 [Fusarium oxysporum f. sp. conglutinans Fo5176]|uniref:Uncharacterized protein n=1 Tax=Fusarium oxysporum (strain Fo5176) TaxID=660025 RepID=F9G984_FUSOF|nr:hypothetical protein FOXB_15216 [Fusarium oxysporum f. sp. conglutinans Fo5176]
MVTETASPAATANSPAKEQDSSLLKTPRSSVQLRQALEYVPASVTQDSTVRLLFRKIGSQLDRYNFEIEKQNREITILQRENEEHRPKRRKKVIYNPNAEFAKIPAIKKAREQMRRTLQPEITANRVQKLKLEDLFLGVLAKVAGLWVTDGSLMDDPHMYGVRNPAIWYNIMQ